MSADARGNQGSTDGETAWSLSIKPVGAEHASSRNEEDGSSFPAKDFVVEVSPDDDIESLYERIEGITGLKASQQRLIYRGRLIGNAHTPTETYAKRTTAAEGDDSAVDGLAGNSSTDTNENVRPANDHQHLRIKDITGLSDGQTIHLVKRRERSVEASSGEGTNNFASRPSGGVETSESSDSGDGAELINSSGSGAAPLLAALLGLGGGGGSSNTNSDEGSTSIQETATGSSRRWRSAASPRFGGSSRRRFNYRLTADDLEMADPGSMESVRQGMMTLHTILPHSQAVSEARQSHGQVPLRSPVETNRRWYVGQWLDCLDTVNQWLEATILEIVHPEDILPAISSASSCDDGDSEDTRRRKQSRPNSHTSGHFTDPVVSSGDLEGRRRLLLEPCEEGDEDEVTIDGISGFRRRSTNDGVQLLLIHYNGWPHRWDEWIRSDSDRIRPFRVRTRHPSSSRYASPTPESEYAESPPTFIRRRDEARRDERLDRAALLPELSRVMTAVNDLVTAAAASSEIASAVVSPSSSTDDDDDDEDGNTDAHSDDSLLPWGSSTQVANEDAPNDGGNSTVVHRSSQPVNSRRQQVCYRRELEALAPLMDRLGRTLIDAAPHVASLASTLPSGEPVDEPPELESIEEHPTSLGGLLSLLSRDRRRLSNASSNVVVARDDTSANTSVQTGAASEWSTASVEPDLTDFAAGVVNTTRGEVRRGPRSRQTSDDAAGLLRAYLAVANLGGHAISSGDNEEDGGNGIRNLGRLLRDGGNGGGIDIHIHAVVTTPGTQAGGTLASLGGGGTTGDIGGNSLNVNDNNDAPMGLFTPVRNFGRSTAGRNNSAPQPVPQDDEDMGIFSELYSETPEPVDPNGSPPSSSATSSSPRACSRQGGDAASRNGTTRANSMPTSRGSRRSPRFMAASDSLDRAGHRRPGVIRRLFRRNQSSSRDS